MQNTQLCDAILNWMNLLPFITKHDSFKQYSNGTIFIEILNRVNADYFGSTHQVLINQVTMDVWSTNVSRLKLIVEKLNEYTHRHNDINVMSIAKDQNQNEILKFFEIVFQVYTYFEQIILKSSFQDEFFGPVLKLEEHQQEIISEFLQQTVEPIYQEEDKNLLDKIDELELENSKLYAQIHSQQQLQKQIQDLEIENHNKSEQIQFLEQYQSKSVINDMHLQELEEANKQLWLLQHKSQDQEELIQNFNNKNQQLNIQLERQSFENEQLKVKLQQSQKLEQKVEQLKEKLIETKNQLQKIIDEKDKQLLQLQLQFQETFNSYQNEKKKSLTLESEMQKLDKKIHEINYEYLEKEQAYIEKIREVSRRNSSEHQDHRTSSNLQIGEYTQLSNELQPQQQDFLNIHNLTLAMAEENYKKEIELLIEKNKSLEQQLLAWKQMNQRSEDKLKQSEQKVGVIADQYTTSQINKQNEQIQYLTKMINSFYQKYAQMKDEQAKIKQNFQ